MAVFAITQILLFHHLQAERAWESQRLFVRTAIHTRAKVVGNHAVITRGMFKRFHRQTQTGLWGNTILISRHFRL